MGKRKVIQFFVLLLVFGTLLAIIQYNHFGSFPGITGFSISEKYSEVDVSDGIYKGLIFNSGKIIFEEGYSEGEFTSGTEDIGRIVRLKEIELMGEFPEGVRMYKVENSVEVLSSDNDGESWSLVQDSEIVQRVLGARTRSQLVEKMEFSIKVYVRACEKIECQNEFIEVDDLTEINLNGRYFQYKLEVSGKEVSIEGLNVVYQFLEDGKGNSEEKSIDNGGEIGKEANEEQEDKDGFETDELNFSEESKTNSSLEVINA